MPLKLTIEERFWAKVNKGSSDNCWLWTACVDKDGYGFFWNGAKQGFAHRYAYEWFVGPIPKGLQIDHLCRVRNCVNPDHLETVTNRENTLRGYAPTAINARKTHCIRNHEFTPENTLRVPRGRHCKACQLLWKKEHITEVRIAGRDRMRARRARLKDES